MDRTGGIRSEGVTGASPKLLPPPSWGDYHFGESDLRSIHQNGSNDASVNYWESGRGDAQGEGKIADITYHV